MRNKYKFIQTQPNFLRIHYNFFEMTFPTFSSSTAFFYQEIWTLKNPHLLVECKSFLSVAH